MSDNSKINIKDVDKLVEKYDDVKKDLKMDLSADEDLSVGIMNLIGIEEHLFFTAEKTGKSKYLEILKEVRKMRVELLKRIVKKSEGEIWCISKHLLSTSMRLMEYGTKKLDRGEEKDAQDIFEKAYGIYSLFWALNMDLIKSDDLKI